MNDHSTLLNRIYRLKVIAVALGAFGIGVALLALARYIDKRASWDWLSFWPISEVGGTLTAAGIFGIAWDYVDGRDKELREDERIRRLLKDSAPDFRDAVIAGFAETPNNMHGVATPETLDKLVTNALSLRLGDEQFASELYRDIRDQAIRASERWYDVQVDLRLSPIGESSARQGAALFDLTVKWEYSVKPATPLRQFVCLSDRDELNELREESPAIVPWLMTPRYGMDPTKTECFELLAFSVDGRAQPIRRRVKKSGQTYSVSLDDASMESIVPVRMKHIYRVVTPQWGHRLFVQLPQPTRGFALSVDYTDAPIAQLAVTDTIATPNPAQISRMPEGAAGDVLSVEVPGWLLPKTGFTLTWVLDSELPHDAESQGSSSGRAA